MSGEPQPPTVDGVEGDESDEEEEQDGDGEGAVIPDEGGPVEDGVDVQAPATA